MLAAGSYPVPLTSRYRTHRDRFYKVGVLYGFFQAKGAIRKAERVTVQAYGLHSAASGGDRGSARWVAPRVAQVVGLIRRQACAGISGI